MKNIITLGLLIATISLFAQQTVVGDYPYKGVDFTAVKLQDNFWLPRMEVNRTASIPHSFQKCEETGRVKNFQMAANHSGKFCTTYPFDDTDIYKNLEAASYSLSIHPDPILNRYCAEFPDNNNRTSNLIIPDNETFTTEFQKDLLGGIVVVKSKAFAVNVDATGTHINSKEQPFMAIPFYARCNRGEGEMRIWFPRKVVNVDLLGF